MGQRTERHAYPVEAEHRRIAKAGPGSIDPQAPDRVMVNSNGSQTNSAGHVTGWDYGWVAAGSV